MPATGYPKTLHHLRSTRDLRAEMLSMAGELVGSDAAEARLVISAPLIAEATIRREWEGLLPAIAPEVRRRMSLVFDAGSDRVAPVSGKTCLPLDPPNYHFEVLRLLVCDALGRRSHPSSGTVTNLKVTQAGLVEALGVSLTPVRSALTALRDARLIDKRNRLSPCLPSLEQLGRLGMLPQTLRFRFARGARVKAPAELYQRAKLVLGRNGSDAWKRLALSGTPVAQSEDRDFNLLGTPRLDLVARVPRGCRAFDVDVLRMLEDGLEPEPNALAPSPVVVTLVRAEVNLDREGPIEGVRCAHSGDVFLALLDMGLVEQAFQYTESVATETWP